MDNNIIIYTSDDENIKISIKLENENLWLSQSQLVELYKSSKTNVSEHIKNIFTDGELQENSVVRNFRTTAKDGKNYNVKHYNLDMFIALGYRIKSNIGIQFRKWATECLNEYMIKGFTMDDDRLKGTGGGDYWNELLNRIHDIRSSEKVIYRQVLDLYATSVDYIPNSKESVVFFKTVQNKLHYAVNKNTSAETIFSRADSEQNFMGLQNFKGKQPTKKEITVAKNYLNEDEIFRLNRLVSAFFDLAELKASEKIKMYMTDWIEELDKYVQIYGKGKLDNAGEISHKKVVEKAEEEYKKYKKRTISPVEEEYFNTIKSLENQVKKGNK